MRDVLVCAFKSLSRKWSRTLLTVSGITVGVAMVAIISMIASLGRAAVNAELDSLGVSGLSVSTAGDGTMLSARDLETIRGLSAVETAMPLLVEFSGSTLRDKSDKSLICGIDAGATQAISLTLKHGRLISRGDVKAQARVCVVDESIALAGYTRGNIVGKSISLNLGGVDEDFEIVGVTETGSSLLQNLTEMIPGMVYIPYTTMQAMTARDGFDQIAVRVKAEADVDTAEIRILESLERSSGNADGYRTDNLAVQKERLGGLMDLVTMLLTAIGGVSLVVSGLGIMTIMLVSVNERTKEIGIKKAIGATRRRILSEFLMEAAVISLIGSLAGLTLGGGLMAVVSALLGWPVSLPAGSFGVLILVAVGIGCVFGVYPAVKASRLRPVEALRREG